MKKITNKDPLIHFPFYINQYQGLLSKYSFTQRGAFISLLSAFLSEDGILPEDKQQLFRICGAFEGQEKEALILVKNEVVRIGKEILVIQKKKRKQCRESAKKGGLKSKRTLTKRLSERSSNTETETDTETETNKEKKKETINNKENNKYLSLSEGLLFVLEEKMNKSISKSKVQAWSDDIRKLIEIDLQRRQDPFEDVKNAIQAIADNYDKDFFPVIQSGKALREKIEKIENFIKRNQPKSNLEWLNK